MRLFTTLTLVLIAAFAGSAMEKPSAHTQGTPTGKPSGTLKPGEYWWAPVVAPSGPVMVLVSIPQQVLHVYRNGILVGRSSVSTGAKGHSTPSGVFTILQKKQTHYSSSYANAPMPNMQRLTWSGICMHSGNLPGYPASHGCIRMPYDFSKLLFTLTANGGTVVIGGEKSTEPHFASNPGVILAPKDFTEDMVKPLPAGGYDWRPERSLTGPVNILVSSADKAIYVYRNGTPIGRTSIQISGNEPLGGHVFSMLEGSSEKWSLFAPFRKARKWLAVASASDNPKKADFEELASRISVSPEFAAKVYDQLSPGATIVVTDEAAIRKPSKDFSILTN